MRLKINKAALEGLSGAEREAAEKAILDLEGERQRNPLAFYRPHAKQRVFHAMDAHTKCFFGGTQSGKTTGGLNDDIIQAVSRDVLPEHLLPYKRFEPPFECRILSQTHKLLENNLISKLQGMIPASELVGGSWKHAYDKQLGVLYFQNGSKFFFMTYETDVGAMQGVTIDRVHFDEEPPLAVYNENKWRVAAKEGDLLFTMTPTQGITWTYDQLWQKRGQEVQAGVFKGQDLEVVQVSQDDNPGLSKRQIELGLIGLSEEEKAARREGKFVALHGLIYGDFSRTRHIVSERPIPEHANVVVGIDPGMRYRAAVVWIYLTPEDQMVVFNEGYCQGMTVEQVCEAIHKVNADFDISPLYYVIDPAARNKNHQTGRSDQMEYADHGIVTIAGQNSVTAGINRVKERFQNDRIYVQSNCFHLIEELEKYRWRQPPKSGEETKQAPVKKDDHLCLARGTLVVTDRGERPIESIRPGERVLTRQGYFPVAVSAQTGANVSVRRLSVEGRELVGTGSHPIWVEGDFRPLDAVRYGDRLMVWSKSSNTEASNFADISNRCTARTASTSRQGSGIRNEASNGCMRRSGSRRTAPSQRATTFTTATKTPSTTTSPISPVSPPSSMRQNIGPRSERPNHASTWRRRAKQPRHGIPRPKVRLGTRSTAGKSWRICSRSLRRASSAARITSPRNQSGSARITASRHGAAHRGSTTRIVPVRPAGTYSASTATARPKLAHVAALGISAAGKADVFNLTVDGPSEYFANGILVSNCDALRYAVMSRPYLPEYEQHSDESPIERLMREDQAAYSQPSEVNVSQFSGIT